MSPPQPPPSSPSPWLDPSRVVAEAFLEWLEASSPESIEEAIDGPLDIFKLPRGRAVFLDDQLLPKLQLLNKMELVLRLFTLKGMGHEPPKEDCFSSSPKPVPTRYVPVPVTATWSPAGDAQRPFAGVFRFPGHAWLDTWITGAMAAAWCSGGVVRLIQVFPIPLVSRGEYLEVEGVTVEIK